jgi:hypothetical protein
MVEKKAKASAVMGDSGEGGEGGGRNGKEGGGDGEAGGVTGGVGGDEQVPASRAATQHCPFSLGSSARPSPTPTLITDAQMTG